MVSNGPPTWADRWLAHAQTMENLAKAERDPQFKEALEYLAQAYRHLAETSTERNKQ